MKRVALLLMIATAGASAQDSSFTLLRVRAGALRLPVVGEIRRDWSAGTGAQLDVASNVGSSEVSLGVGHIGFHATSGKPAFTETMFSLAWTYTVIRRRSLAFDAGARLTDVRMDFDDPSLVGGLRTEEEQLISVLGRGWISLTRKYSGFVEATYGTLMTSTRTTTVSLAVGVQRDAAMPSWLRNFLR